MAKVAILMGSNSDLPVVKGAIDQLKKFDIDFEAHVISAHRTPYDAESFAKNAKKSGGKVIIAAAGKAAPAPQNCSASRWGFAGRPSSWGPASIPASAAPPPATG